MPNVDEGCMIFVHVQQATQRPICNRLHTYTGKYICTNICDIMISDTQKLGSTPRRRLRHYILYLSFSLVVNYSTTTIVSIVHANTQLIDNHNPPTHPPLLEAHITSPYPTLRSYTGNRNSKYVHKDWTCNPPLAEWFARKDWVRFPDRGVKARTNFYNRASESRSQLPRFVPAIDDYKTPAYPPTSHSRPHNPYTTNPPFVYRQYVCYHSQTGMRLDGCPLDLYSQLATQNTHPSTSHSTPHKPLHIQSSTRWMGTRKDWVRFPDGEEALNIFDPILQLPDQLVIAKHAPIYLVPLQVPRLTDVLRVPTIGLLSVSALKEVRAKTGFDSQTDTRKWHVDQFLHPSRASQLPACGESAIADATHQSCTPVLAANWQSQSTLPFKAYIHPPTSNSPFVYGQYVRLLFIIHGIEDGIMVHSKTGFNSQTELCCIWSG
ncbi:uncharacterized protein LACBIDRAFT_333760 [Laccaria bicolor S238N-H82]|uniref:Predicted protein n=1 Tax=Laccaria bicolor (strain S238N-H82 / ATCC MYA-4686) TaxID=486041 RepID=B0DWZ6_LACBS|nr:uncharacterized protein LACBIDRAFT_333760 [Laccaria bicolor S238N-H82]EDR00846.1 predicted protein [Laccaria bicolor S238N-H82]|eukprot:XP_001888440.1 predicted protein [Laccaria bicolor S238N-H82]